MKPGLPTNCRQHANGRVMEIERHYANGELDYECATFLCGCTANVTLLEHMPYMPPTWRLDESTFWKEGQA